MTDPRMLSRDGQLQYIKRLREENYSDDEIVHIFKSGGKGFDRSGGLPQATVRGANTGMANVLGTPVDLLTGLINANLRQPATLPSTSLYYDPQPPQITNPLLGSQSIRSGMDALLGDKTTYESLGDLPPEERPFGVAGENIGGSLATLGAGLGLAPVRAAASAAPRQFMALETAGTLGAAGGGGASEYLFPGRPGLRATNEILGGFLAPSSLLARYGPSAARGTGQFLGSFTKEGRERSAARLVQEEMLNAGDDPTTVAARLRVPGLTSNMPSAAVAESPTLYGLERTLAREDKKFGGDLAAQYDTAIGDLRSELGTLTSRGDAQNLRQVAAMRYRQFSDMIGRLITNAQRVMQGTTGNLGGGTIRQQTASGTARHALEDAYTEARAGERALWQQVPRDITVKPRNVLDAYGQLRTTILPSEQIQPIVESEVRRLSPRQEPTGVVDSQGNPLMTTVEPDATTGELLRLRSRMLDLARDARARGDKDMARQFGAIADAALRDLDTVPGDIAAEARAYSHAMNDAFTRTFAGDALSVKDTGADRIPGERMLERGFGGGGIQGDVNLRGLQQATDFPMARGGSAEPAITMQREQENFLRAAAGDLLDREGRVNPERLRKWRQDNESTLQRFPGLRRQLENAESAEQTLRQVERRGTTLTRDLEQRSVLSKLLGAEDPGTVVGRAWTSDNPRQEFTKIANVARKGGADAQAGLKSATLDWATRQATDASGNFSFARFRELLTQPSRKGGVNLLRTMELHGVLSRGDSVRLEQILNEAGKIEKALASQRDLGKLKDMPGALYDLVVRLVGANVGGHGAIAQVSGAPLLASSAGVRAAKTLFEKVPAGRMREVLVAAAKDPKIMAALLERSTSVARRQAIDAQINAFLIQAGLTSDEE